MSDGSRRAERVVSVVAATLASLACGTNYVYSAWGPQLATKLHLTSTEINWIGTSANWGMYATGIPVGILIDKHGPRGFALLGAFCLGFGYFPIHTAYESGEGSMSVPILCFFSFLTGAGSCMSFFSALKTATLNWPENRGTATAFPLAAFGLSAFFFASVSSVAFPNDTSEFLFLLSIGTFTLVFVSFFFLRIIPHTPKYTPLSTHDGLSQSDSTLLQRKKSGDSDRSPRRDRQETGTITDGSSPTKYNFGEATNATKSPAQKTSRILGQDASETSSLVSSSSSWASRDIAIEAERCPADYDPPGDHVDIRGLDLLRKAEFWQQFILLGTLTGVGLMTINNIGNDANALWSHYDDSVQDSFIKKRQLMHVSIVSLVSFCGRLISGVGSDIIVKRLHLSRFWCIVVSSSTMAAAQICALSIENPHFLWLVSGLIGLAYGFLFGVFPTLVSEAFGVRGLSQNWGCMCLAAVFFGNFFNLVYGRIYDSHSVVLPTGKRICQDGIECYRAAYSITFVASVGGICLSLWSIHTEHRRKGRVRKSSRLLDGGVRGGA
ncbi:MAG: hypothetical protein M1825_005689 [Sarcosagium campestre]|nr:MAG: hypothetical protein M1825_005689 [Sarcosagium campestre]